MGVPFSLMDSSLAGRTGLPTRAVTEPSAKAFPGTVQLARRLLKRSSSLGSGSDLDADSIGLKSLGRECFRLGL